MYKNSFKNIFSNNNSTKKSLYNNNSNNSIKYNFHNINKTTTSKTNNINILYNINSNNKLKNTLIKNINNNFHNFNKNQKTNSNFNYNSYKNYNQNKSSNNNNKWSFFNNFKFNNFRFKNRNNKNSNKKSFFNYSKRNFNDNNNNPFNFLHPFLQGIVAFNTALYLYSFSMTEPQYLRDFLYNKASFNNGKVHSLITCHFAKTNFIDYLLDTALVGLIGFQLTTMVGPDILAKILLYSFGCSVALLLTMHNNDYYIKSDAFMRGLIIYTVATNPGTSFTLLPFPIKIKASYIGIFIVGMDFITAKWCNFGGTIGAFLVARRLV